MTTTRPAAVAGMFYPDDPDWRKSIMEQSRQVLLKMFDHLPVVLSELENVHAD